MTTRLLTATTPVLDIGYEAGGSPDGFPVVLLHGWPDDVRTWDAIVSALRAAGFRTLVPYLRGSGPTRFRGAEIPRSGQLAAFGADVLQFADAVGLRRFAVIGHDWGARAAYIAACAAPERVAACVALSVGWGTNDPAQPLPLNQAQNYWYHWLMALPRGEALIRDERHRFTRHIWTIWNPGWPVSDASFAATAAAFDNPDWAQITLHSYRVRWGLAEPTPCYAALESRLAADPVIRVPTLTLHGGGDPCNDPATSENRDMLFAGFYRRVVLSGLGHFPQRQAPEAVLREIGPFLKRMIDRDHAARAVERSGSGAPGTPSSGSDPSLLRSFARLVSAKPPSLTMLGRRGWFDRGAAEAD